MSKSRNYYWVGWDWKIEKKQKLYLFRSSELHVPISFESVGRKKKPVLNTGTEACETWPPGKGWNLFFLFSSWLKQTHGSGSCSFVARLLLCSQRLCLFGKGPLFWQRPQSLAFMARYCTSISDLSTRDRLPLIPCTWNCLFCVYNPSYYPTNIFTIDL